jgi:hypothetical protein
MSAGAQLGCDQHVATVQLWWGMHSQQDKRKICTAYLRPQHRMLLLHTHCQASLIS